MFLGVNNLQKLVFLYMNIIYICKLIYEFGINIYLNYIFILDVITAK